MNSTHQWWNESRHDRLEALYAAHKVRLLVASGLSHLLSFWLASSSQLLAWIETLRDSCNLHTIGAPLLFPATSSEAYLCEQTTSLWLWVKLELCNQDPRQAHRRMGIDNVHRLAPAHEE
jgi:hypothetical protein